MFIEKKALSRDENIFVVSNSLKSKHELQEDYHVPTDKIITIHNAVDTQRFSRDLYPKEVSSIRIKLGLTDENKPIFLFLGSGYNRKGLEPTLKAFSKIDFEASLIIIGNETHPEKYISMAKDLNIYDKCHFLGKKSKPEHYFSLASCYVFPTKYEPFGFTAIESLSCGCPVITTDSCGAKEVMNDTVSTILKSDFSIEELCSSMKKWTKNLSLPKEDVQSLCRTSVLRLDVEKIMDDNYKIIKKVKAIKDSL